MLALQFQAARFLRPFLLAGGLLLRQADRVIGAQIEQLQQRMRGVAFDQQQLVHGARHGHIQRVDVELEQLQRMVGLVAGAAVVQRVAGQVLRLHAFGDFGKGLALA